MRGPAARRPPETAAKIIVSGSIPAFAAVFFPGTGKCTGTCGRRRETGEAADGKRGQSTELPPPCRGAASGTRRPEKKIRPEPDRIGDQLKSASTLATTSSVSGSSGNTWLGLRYQSSLPSLKCSSPPPVTLSMTVASFSTLPAATALMSEANATPAAE